MAEFIGHGNWLVATFQPLHFSVVCQNKSVTSVQINPPVGILHVKTSCIASNSFFSLISPFRYQLNDTMTEFMRIQFDKIPLNLWRILQTSFPNILKIQIPDRLKDIRQIPMESLIRELHNVAIATAKISFATLGLFLNCRYNHISMRWFNCTYLQVQA